MRPVPLPLVALLGVGVLLGSASEAGAQADPLHFTFNSGQTVQPVFDGWTRNADGSFEMHFGYLNRNYVEELHVPVGAANHLSPGEDDQGQPTYFYPRIQRRVFSVTVPADFGDERLTWEVTVRDETYRAEAWLQPEWEIAANPAQSFYADREGGEANQPPALSPVEVPSAIAAGETVSLTAAVSDDGLPEPRTRGGRPPQPPTFEPVEGPTLPVNVPQVRPAARKRPTRFEVDGVNVTWTQLRGPAGARLEAGTDAGDGIAAVKATFASAGAYRFRVEASDGPESVVREFEVTVH